MSPPRIIPPGERRVLFALLFPSAQVMAAGNVPKSVGPRFPDLRVPSHSAQSLRFIERR